MNGLSVVLLFSVATVVAVVARRFKLPYTVALVVAGLALGRAHAFDAPHLTKELLYTIFLPGLLFEAAFHLEFKRFRQNKIAIVGLALPGVIAAVVLTATALGPTLGVLDPGAAVGFGAALVFAALIAATDPIAVVALFKSLGAPKRLAVLVEGESLFNDGTAVVVFTIVFALVSGGPASIAHGGVELVRVVGMGIVVGGVLGYGISFAIHQIDDPMIETTLTTIAAYGSFVVAERFHFSGVIATVTAGMFCGNHGARTGMSASTRVTVLTFWEYVAFALNSLVFLLIGLEVNLSSLLAAAGPIVVTWLLVTLARGAVIQVVALALRRTRERISTSWTVVLTWGGLRGALSMVLALGLPADFEHREFLVTLTFGVVVLSILLQGTTMGWLLRRLGVAREASERGEHERLLAVIESSRAAIEEIDRLKEQGHVEDAVAKLRASYVDRIARAERDAVVLEKKGLAEEDRAVATRRALLAEKDSLTRAFRSGRLAEHSYEALVAEVDARLFDVDGYSDDPVEPAA